VALLRQRLADAGYGQVIVNASVSGETTSGGRARIAKVLSTHMPAVVIVELGANDALRGLPVAQMEENLVAIIRAIHEAHSSALMVGVPLPGNYGPEYSAAVELAFRKAASRTHVGLVPSLLKGIHPASENFQADRLHPVAEVQPMMLDNVWPALRPLLAPPLKH
jgi:acyl-CoA thioesterase-1